MDCTIIEMGVRFVGPEYCRMMMAAELPILSYQGLLF